MNFREDLTEDRAGNLRIWDYPQVGVEYVAGIDVSEGKKRDRSALQRRGLASYSDQRVDYSAIVMLELETGLHVATWHGYVPPEELASIAAAIGIYYNMALLVPELNGPGLAVVTRLIETLRYDNLYRSTMVNMLDMDPLLPRFGFQTSASSRPILIMRIGEVLGSGLFTRDERLVGELRTLEFDDQGTPRARGKNKDDIVFALALALQGRHVTISMLPAKKPEPENDERAYDAKVWARLAQIKERSNVHGTGRYRSLRAGGLSRGGAGRPGR